MNLSDKETTNDISCTCGHLKQDHQFSKPEDMSVHFRTKAGNNQPKMFPIQNLDGFCTQVLCSCIKFTPKQTNSLTQRRK